MIKKYVKDHPVIISIILFCLIYFTLQISHPKYLYDDAGALKTFGIGYRNKTVFPIWIFAICLAILCYVFVMFSIIRNI